MYTVVTTYVCPTCHTQYIHIICVLYTVHTYYIYVYYTQYIRIIYMCIIHSTDVLYDCVLFIVFILVCTVVWMLNTHSRKTFCVQRLNDRDARSFTWSPHHITYVCMYVCMYVCERPLYSAYLVVGTCSCQSPQYNRL